MEPATLTKAYIAINTWNFICFFGLPMASAKDAAKVNNSGYYYENILLMPKYFHEDSRHSDV
jgi:hypothetical protein